ncbi:MAG: hypothetical protein EA397_13155 [Deltaproteobacteria bacterium]|nr:MAG: hypothetical protein EA397_13155 [Deltaproteobacteria bacterium]
MLDKEQREHLTNFVESEAFQALLDQASDEAAASLRAFAQGVRAGELDDPQALRARLSETPGDPQALQDLLPQVDQILGSTLDELGQLFGGVLDTQTYPDLNQALRQLQSQLKELPPDQGRAVQDALRAMQTIDLEGLTSTLKDLPELLEGLRSAAAQGQSPDAPSLAALGQILGTLESKADQLGVSGEHLERARTALRDSLNAPPELEEALQRAAALSEGDPELQADWLHFERASLSDDPQLALQRGPELALKAAERQRFRLSAVVSERLASLHHAQDQTDDAARCLLDASSASAAAGEVALATTVLEQAAELKPSLPIRRRALLLWGRLGELSDDTDTAQRVYREALRQSQDEPADPSIAMRASHALARLHYGQDRTIWLARATQFAKKAGDPSFFTDRTIELALHLDERSQRKAALQVLHEGRAQLSSHAALKRRLEQADQVLADRWGQATFQQILADIS